MRRLSTITGLSLSLVALFAAAPSASAAEPRGVWDGFGVGSYVHQKSSTKMSGVPNMPDMPAQVMETKQTLVKIADDAWTVKYETKTGEEWQAYEMPFPRKGQAATAPKPEDLGEETLTVDGETLPCRKQKTVVEGATTIAWVNEKYGAVKSETTSTPGTSSTYLVTKLKGTTKIGSVEVEYREAVMTSKGVGTESKVTSWTSDAVPGGSVRSEMTSSMQGGMTTTTVTETLAFEKK
jgi:hypothetical protein